MAQATWRRVGGGRTCLHREDTVACFKNKIRLHLSQNVMFTSIMTSQVSLLRRSLKRLVYSCTLGVVSSHTPLFIYLYYW